MTIDLKSEIKVVRPEKQVMTRQALPYFVGISSKSVGAKNLSMNLVVIPPGGSSKPHYHKNFETAIYILEGEVENFYGEGLKQRCITKKGDFLYIPRGVPHQPFNLSDNHPATAIVSRNDPDERENVVLYETKGK